MDPENQINNSGQSRPTTGNDGVTGRRRFVRGVAAVVPVVLTAGSRSALATTGCLSPSASASINLLHSRPDRPKDGSCRGRTPGYWKNAAVNHNDKTAKNTKWGSVFSSGFTGLSMEQVAALTGNAGFEALARHLAAAWCNLQKGWVSPTVLNLADLQAMWDGRSGTYSPVAGVTWSAGQMVDYLVMTQPY